MYMYFINHFQIIYDLTQPYGSRVHSVEVRCADCRVPSYTKLDKSANYTILTSDYMRGGGDGYAMLMDLQYTTVG